VAVRGVAGACLGLVLVGCGSGESAATKRQDQTFVNQVVSATPDATHYRSNTQLIRLGLAACDDFATGSSYEEIADRLALSEGSNPLPTEDLGAVITSAVDTFCPKYSSLVN
jgi:Protein of unknown function (DUF732)